MYTSRRTFLKSGAMFALGAAILPRSVFAAKAKKGIVGLQLYSVRDDMMKDPKGSLTQLAKMGYVYVEHANYVNQKFYGFLAPEFRKVLDDLGLKMISGHTVMGKEHWDAGCFLNRAPFRGRVAGSLRPRTYATHLLHRFSWADSSCPRQKEVVIVKIAVHAARDLRRFRPERGTSALQEDDGHNASNVGVGVRGEPSEACAGVRTRPGLA